MNKTLQKKYAFVFAILAIFLISPKVKSQDMMGKTGLIKLWDGIKMKQPEDQMPHGNAPYQTATRKQKKEIPTKLVPTQEGEWIITDGWELGTSTQVIESEESIFSSKFDTKDWYNATVPGTVLTTLVEQGVYPDPYFGLNNMAIPDTLAHMDWWYRTTFDTPSNISGERIRLLFNGINYRSQIFLNGKKLGNTAGAFMRNEYDVTSLLKPSGEKNVLAVLVSPPDNPGISHEQSMVAGQGLNGGQLSLDGPTFIASIGWDWIPGIRDRNTGIWQDVRLKVGRDVAIGDPQIITKLALPDTTKAIVKIIAPIKNLTNKTVTGTVSAKFEGVDINLPYTLNAHQSKDLVFDPANFKELNIKNPKLWWPNGYGAPNLYNLELQANVGNDFSDLKKYRFGIRELSYEMMISTPEKGNHRVAYTPVNVQGQQPIFDYENVVKVGDPKLNRTIPTLLKGVNEDAVFEQLSNDDPVGQYFVFRVNGQRIFIKGGTFGLDDGMKRVSRDRMEPAFKLHKDANFNMIRNWVGESTEEEFYELADEYGMLVWNDFWITTDDTVEPNDYPLFMENATDVVRRFRTHPSIAIWCPRNEGYAPEGMEPLLVEMMAKEDPTRHYHGNSRFLNAINSGPYGFIKDQKRYFTESAEGFNTEFGAQAIPTANTIRKFIAPEDLWPINDVWAYHDLHHTTHFFNDFIDAVNSYGKATNVDEFAKKSQMVTYDVWRAMIESWNSRMWDNTTGLILWMSHPAWPSMTWQTYTYDFETPGSYFGAKKAQEPVHIQQNLHNDQIVIVNSTRHDYKNMTAIVRYYDLQGKEYYSKSEKYDVPANGKIDCFIPELPTNDIKKYTLARIELKDSKGRIISVNDYWKNWGNIQANSALNALGTPNLKLVEKKSKIGDEYLFELSNDSKDIAVAVKLNARNRATNEIILPAYFSDGYINLLPGEKREIRLKLPIKPAKGFEVIADGYNFEPEVLF